MACPCPSQKEMRGFPFFFGACMAMRLTFGRVFQLLPRLWLSFLWGGGAFLAMHFDRGSPQVGGHELA